jgi:hypothetical protein
MPSSAASSRLASDVGTPEYRFPAFTASPIATLRLPAGATNLAGIDGLYLHGGALIGIQNAVGHPRIVRLPLAASGRAATRIEVIESGSPIVDNPTTGVVIDAAFVFMARRNREHAFASGPPARDALEDIVIAAIDL